MRILVTGGAGFIGSNFILYWLERHPQDEVINVDLLTYAGNLENLRAVETDPRYRLVRGDIIDRELMEKTLSGVEVVVNFAAESHNDRAVLDPGAFVRTNVLGTQALLEAARRAAVKRFHHISTCEVFGELELNEARVFAETDAYRPRTPYNASKAGANHIAMAYFYTFGLPVTISHSANNYGPYQFPEKLIPLFITNAIEDKPLPLFKSSQNRREWIHVRDHCAGIEQVLTRGTPGQAYNIGSGVEKSIEEITAIILQTLGKPESLKTYVPDRLGHDKRYLLDNTKIKTELGWSSQISFVEGMASTIKWYVDNQAWWRRVKSGSYQKYYQDYYQNKIGQSNLTI